MKQEICKRHNVDHTGTICGECYEMYKNHYKKAKPKKERVPKRHAYELTIRFETSNPVKKYSDAMIQFENALSHLVCEPRTGLDVESILNDVSSSLKKLTATKRSTARKHKRKRKTVKKPRIYKLWGDSVVY